MIIIHFDDWWSIVFSVENDLTGHIHAQPEYELAQGRWQPVGFMTHRSGFWM